MTDEDFTKRLEKIENCYQQWHANSAFVKNLEKQTVEDLMREAFFAGYEKGEEK